MSESQWNVVFTFDGGTTKHFGPFGYSEAQLYVTMAESDGARVFIDEHGRPVRVNYNLATVVEMYKVS